LRRQLHEIHVLAELPKPVQDAEAQPARAHVARLVDMHVVRRLDRIDQLDNELVLNLPGDERHVRFVPLRLDRLAVRPDVLRPEGVGEQVEPDVRRDAAGGAELGLAALRSSTLRR
jgi:hypothetical protein